MMMIALARFDYLLDIAHQRLKKLLLALIDGLDLFKLAVQLLKPVVKLLLIHFRNPYESGKAVGQVRAAKQRYF